MDRFIALALAVVNELVTNLKSNMDRFIEWNQIPSYLLKYYLKSNMDRFIAPFSECELVIPY